jgi:hypothetical protein
MADFTIVQGDSAPAFTDTLEYSNKEPVNLTGATVKFVMRALSANEPTALTGATSVLSPTEGKVAFSPTAADTSVVGNYMASWVVTFTGGQRMTFPTQGYLWVQIQENLTTIGGAQLVGLPEVKEHLRIPANDRTHDEMLVGEVEAVGPLIENLVGPVLPQTYDEWYEGGHVSISLRHKPSYGAGTSPLLNLMAVSEYRGPIEYNLSIIGTPTQGSVYSTMLNAELGIITRRTSGGGSTPFWRDPEHPQQSVHVVYQAGQERTPVNVRRAALEAVRWWFETTQPVGRGRQTAADTEVIQPRVALPYHCIAMLEPTKRHPSIA